MSIPPRSARRSDGIDRAYSNPGDRTVTGREMSYFAGRFWELPADEKYSFALQFIRGLSLRRTVHGTGWVLAGSRVKVKVQNGRMGVDRLCRLGDSVQIAVVGAHKNAPAVFSIGYNTHILDRTKINVSTSVTIGSECSISWDCDILDSDFHAIVDAEGQKLSVTKPIIIGDHVWIGCNSIILKGVTIQHHSIVAAGSVVTCDIPPFTLVGGNPARKIKLIHDWLRNPCDGE